MTAGADPVKQERARLVQTAFMYIATCLKGEDSGAIGRLRLRPDQVARLAKMTARDLLRLAELGQACLSIDIDPEGLDEVLQSVDRQRRREELIERCIERDAPRAMMQAFFGLSRHRYSRVRALLGMPATVGRYRRPSPAIERAIYEAWNARGRAWSPQCLLEIADGLDLSLRAVWDELRRFNGHGAPDSRKDGR